MEPDDPLSRSRWSLLNAQLELLARAKTMILGHVQVNL